jgi:hypothetical protein
MSNREILISLFPRLNSLLSCELRLKGSSKFVTSDYICGFNSTHDISIKVNDSGLDIPLPSHCHRDPVNFHFKIEYLQHTILQKWCEPNDETLNNFLYILEDLIQTSERIKNQAKSFPNLTDEDNRDVKLKKLFEKNSYIPLVP